MATREAIRHFRRTIQNACFSFRAAGAVLFGSAARGDEKPDSDADLLVVGIGLPQARHRRSRETAEVKRVFAPLPLDVILMTSEEVQSNFRNHNPLFLDIAEDGIILLDTDGLLEGLISTTRRYVAEKGIERIAGGWRFQVERGAATFLSKVSNADFSAAMLRDAERDHQVGCRLSAEGFHDKAVYHFQQAVEKSIKAVLIALGVFKRTHAVGESLEGLCAAGQVPPEWRERLLTAAEHSANLEADLSLSRYPGIVEDQLWLPSEEYVPEDARAAEARSTETLGIARAFVDEWFSGPAE